MAALFWVLGSMVTSVLALGLVYRTVPLEWLQPAHETVGNYLQTVGTIYAVLLAFVVFVVWQQHNDANRLVHQEANNLLDMARLLRSFPAPANNSLLQLLHGYTKAIVGPEWSDMVAGKDCHAAWRQLEALWDQLVATPMEAPQQQALFSEALARFNDLSDTRANRIHSAQTRIPAILWALLASGAVVVVGSMDLFALRDFPTHAVMTAALAGAVSHVLYVIWDLDNCFQGYWCVSNQAYHRVLQALPPG